MKTLWHIVRLLLGMVFIFSGFVKGIDPLGSAYKFTDYFNAWGMESLTPVALPLSILLSATEFIIGLALVANVFISFFSVASLLFMAFFTGVTLISAITNPVTDCGCLAMHWFWITGQLSIKTFSFWPLPFLSSATANNSNRSGN